MATTLLIEVLQLNSCSMYAHASSCYQQQPLCASQNLLTRKSVFSSQKKRDEEHSSLVLSGGQHKNRRHFPLYSKFKTKLGGVKCSSADFAEDLDVSNEDYGRLVWETLKEIGNDMQNKQQPSDPLNTMHLVGDGLGLKVECSKGRISVRAKAATVEHGQAIQNMSFFLRADNDSRWKFALETLLQLSTGDRREADIVGFRKPIKLSRGSAEMQKPDWICEVLSRKTKEQDSPDGDKFLEYEASGIPYYWIVDPLKGHIDVFQLKAEGYELILSTSVNDKAALSLKPFDTKLDLDVVFDYLFD